MAPACGDVMATATVPKVAVDEVTGWPAVTSASAGNKRFDVGTPQRVAINHCHSMTFCVTRWGKEA